MLDDLIELLPLFSTFEPVHPANSHQALQTSINRIRITGSQQLKCDIQETRPLLGKVMLKNFLQERDKLGANIRGRRCEGRDQPFPKRWFLLVGNRCLQRAVFDGSPTPVDAVFEVNAGYRAITSVRPYRLFLSSRNFSKEQRETNQRKHTRQLHSVYLLRLQDIQKCIDESGLRFGLHTIPPENKHELAFFPTKSL